VIMFEELKLQAGISILFSVHTKLLD